MKQWFSLWVLVNVIDLATTLVCVSLGGGESNPVLRGLIHSSVWGAIAYKMLVSTFIGLILVRLGLLGILRVATLTVGFAAFGNSIWMVALWHHGDDLAGGPVGYWGIVLVAVCIAGALAAHKLLWTQQGRLYSRRTRYGAT